MLLYAQGVPPPGKRWLRRFFGSVFPPTFSVVSVAVCVWRIVQGRPEELRRQNGRFYGPASRLQGLYLLVAMLGLHALMM